MLRMFSKTGPPRHPLKPPKLRKSRRTKSQSTNLRQENSPPTTTMMKN